MFLSLEYAKYVNHPQTNMPVVELSIDGHIGYLFDVDINKVNAGFVELHDSFDGEPYWNEHLQKIRLSDAVAKKYGFPSILEGCTTDPAVIRIARQYWDDSNNDRFRPGTILFRK